MKLVSVIVPMYNSEATIYRCIESICKQSYEKLEILIINDGSTDSSLSLCEKLQANDNRITIINKANEGVSAARNDGLKLANGEFITFVDSDDFVDIEMIKSLYEASEKYHADIVEGGYSTVIDEKIEHNYSFTKELNESSLDALTSFLSGKNNADALWNKMYRRNVIKDIRFNNFKFSEDFLFNVYALLNSEVKVTIDQIVYYYDITNENSATKQKISNRNLEDIQIRENLINEFTDSKFPEKVIQLLQASIIKKVIFLDIRYIKSDEENTKIKQYLNAKFKEYMSDTEFHYIKNIYPKKVFYSIMLRKYTPHLYTRVLKKYFLN